MGVDVHSVGVVPTPALAFLAGDGRFEAGIMVSASHNPAEDNGLKVLDPRPEARRRRRGGSRGARPPRDELPGVPPRPGSAGPCDASGLIQRYVAHRTGPRARPIPASGLHVVLDTANGAAYRVGPEILRATGAPGRR